MSLSYSQLSEAEIEALSSVIAEVNMLRANGSEQSSIATEDALRYLRAAKYNSTRALEIYKNYQKHRESYGLDDVKPYREPLNSEISSGKLQILGTSDDEDSPILLFTGSKHDSKYSKMEASMQLLFHTLDQIANNDTAQNKGIVFLFDLRDSSQDSKYIRNILSVLLNGYPLLLKMIYIVGAPIWVKPFLFTVKLQRVKYVSPADLLQHFSDHQLPISLGGKFHPHSNALPLSPVSPNHAPHHPKLPRQQSHPDNLCDVSEGDKVGERAKLVGNLVSVFDSRNRVRSHSGGATDKTNLRPLLPKSPSHSSSHESSARARPLMPVSKSQASESSRLKLRNWFQQADKQESKPENKPENKPHPSHLALRGKPILPPQGVAGNTKKATPSSHAQSSDTSSATGGIALADDDSQAPPTSTGRTGIASRIQNFERQVDSSSSSFHISKGPGKNGDDEVGRAQKYVRTGRPSRPLVSVQIGVGEFAGGEEKPRETERGGERERGGEWGDKERRERSREDEQRKRREEEMRRLRREEDRLQRERRDREKAAQSATHTQPLKKSAARLLDDYENVDLSPFPPAISKSKEVPPSSGPAADLRRRAAADVTSARDKPMQYENVAIHYVRSASNSPEPPRMGLGQPSGGARGLQHWTRDHNEKGGVASGTAKPPTKHQYENISIITAAGPIPYLHDTSSSDSEDFSGDESPAPQEVIYENFGFDKGNQSMGVEELEKYLSQQEKKGISAEYLRIKNEPMAHSHTACKVACNLPKNRYKDVVCYDNSRVVLETLPGIEGSDYIHANYVSSYKKQKAFILTQGPTKKTLVDFWRMVWEQQVHVVVMTTKCVELGRHKCTQYWPDEGVVQYGNVTVTVAKIQQCEGYEMRTMKITCGGAERTVKHFQFLAWPDYGVPASGQAVLNLILAVRDAQARAKLSATDQKVVVHCSAGVGRSGAYCVINNCMDEFNEKGVVNVQAAVRHLRLQRAYAIQTDEQYMFCYKTVLQFMKSALQQK